MSVAPRVEAHLARVGVNYDLIQHPETHRSSETARSAHIPSVQLAKSVMTHDGENYRLCVIPSNHKLVMSWLNQHMKGHYRLVHEDELNELFDDCQPGAIPPLGQVYGLPVIWDNSLKQLDDIYFESGDHRSLIHVNQGSFMQLMGLQDNNAISCPSDDLEGSAYFIH
jgi:Ala-tRNA(Pro) deacylase